MLSLPFFKIDEEVQSSPISAVAQDLATQHPTGAIQEPSLSSRNITNENADRQQHRLLVRTWLDAKTLLEDNTDDGSVGRQFNDYFKKNWIGNYSSKDNQGQNSFSGAKFSPFMWTVIGRNENCPRTTNG